MPERGTDGRPGGVDARDHEQDHGAADVLGEQLLAVELGADEERGEVVARLGPVRRDLGVHIGVDLAVGDQGQALLRGHVHVFEHLLDEVAEDVGVLLWETEHADDDAQRDVPGVLDGGVELGLAGGGVEQLRCERREEHPARHGVERWVGGDGGRNSDRCGQVLGSGPNLAHHDRTRGEVLGVVSHRGDVVMADW